MKRIIGLMIAVVCFAAYLAVPVSAVNSNFVFYMTSGGQSVFSALTLKSGGSAYENKWYVTPKESQGGISSNWVADEVCRFRVRTSSREIASNLYSKTQGTGSANLYGKTFNHPYSITSVGGASYYLYADKPASDPFDELCLVGTWCP